MHGTTTVSKCRLTRIPTAVLTLCIYILAHILNLYVGSSFFTELKCVVPGKFATALDSSFI